MGLIFLDDVPIPSAMLENLCPYQHANRKHSETGG